MLAVTAAVCLLAAAGSVAVAEGHFRLVVLHNNDMHARFEQTNGRSGKCTQKFQSTNYCFGGFARVAQVVKDVRSREENVLFLNAGDTFQGTTWYTVHKWRVVAFFVNLIGLDAMSLGNHEFDDGVAGLAPFLENVTVPNLAANLNVSSEPSLSKIQPSVVLQVGGRKIGVIGYLTPETRDLAKDVGNAEFEDEVPAIQREVNRLQAAGVNILIALGHSGHSVDKKIAQQVDGLDLVIGGHTNTFLYTGHPPDSEVPSGPYPTMVKQASGRLVPVVQAYAYTKYMGMLNMTFDASGEIVNVQGNPILLDFNIQQDPAILAELKPWAAKVANLTKEKIGQTLVFLNGSQSACRMEECNLGNLIADSFVHHNARSYSGRGWTDAPIAIHNGGGIRNSIEKSSETAGYVTMEDILAVLPFQAGLMKMKLQGKYLLEALEESVRYYDFTGTEAPGRFLQYSGLNVVYDMKKPPGERVKSVTARCGDCRVPIFYLLDPEETYSILMSQYLADGGDGFHVFSNRGINRTILDAEESSIFAEFIRQNSPVFADVEGRITLLIGTADSGATSLFYSASLHASWIVLLVLYVL